MTFSPNINIARHNNHYQFVALTFPVKRSFISPPQTLHITLMGIINWLPRTCMCETTSIIKDTQKYLPFIWWKMQPLNFKVNTYGILHRECQTSRWMDSKTMVSGLRYHHSKANCFIKKGSRSTLVGCWSLPVFVCGSMWIHLVVKIAFLQHDFFFGVQLYLKYI